MSIAELKAEIDRLSPEEREEMRDYLRSKIRPMSEEERRIVTEKLNDRNSANWLTLEEAEKRLFSKE
jgi:hypothetical protein